MDRNPYDITATQIRQLLRIKPRIPIWERVKKIFKPCPHEYVTVYGTERAFYTLQQCLICGKKKVTKNE